MSAEPLYVRSQLFSGLNQMALCFQRCSWCKLLRHPGYDPHRLPADADHLSDQPDVFSMSTPSTVRGRPARFICPEPYPYNGGNDPRNSLAGGSWLTPPSRTAPAPTAAT